MSMDIEPPFEGVKSMWIEPMYGPCDHSDEQLRAMWSFIWDRFHDKRMCRSFMQFHRLHSIKRWKSAIEITRRSKPHVGNFNYIVQVANNLLRRELCQ